MALVPWLSVICAVFVASSPVVNTSLSLALPTSNQTSHLRPNGSPLDIVSALPKSPFLHLGGPRSAVTSNRSRLSDSSYRCSSQSFGRPLAAGCQEAYEAITESSRLVDFADRISGSGLGVPLPLRLISCEQSTWRLGYDVLLSAVTQLMKITADGKSVVEVSHVEGAISDRVSGQDLRLIASSLVQICVTGKNEGGMAIGIGRYKRCPIGSVPSMLNVFRGTKTFDLVGPGVYAECGVFRSWKRSRGHWELSSRFGRDVHSTTSRIIWTSRNIWHQRGPSARP